MRQVEVSRTMVFDAPRHARRFLEALCTDNLDIGRPEEMQIVFGRRGVTAPEGGYRTRLLRCGDGVTLNAYFRHSRVIPEAAQLGHPARSHCAGDADQSPHTGDRRSLCSQTSLVVEVSTPRLPRDTGNGGPAPPLHRIKFCLKRGRAFRIETVINNTGNLGVLRRLEHLAEISRKARDVNRRMVDAFRVGQGCVLASPAWFENDDPAVVGGSDHDRVCGRV
jgi:hypothetical protein